VDLFEANRQQKLEKTAPLAYRMSPKTLEEMVGQNDILGEGKLLRRLIESDHLYSLILYGPPGSGKTALARLIALKTKAHFEQVNAVTSGVAELREIIKEAKERMALYSQRTILFIDEIHRFNKAQQDALLPSVEEGFVVLIGATTQNPYFEVNSALLSRSQVFKFNPLTTENIITILKRALADEKRGLGSYKVKIEPEALRHLAEAANGDARIALNALEVGVVSTLPDKDGIRHITLEVAEESIQRRAVRYDKMGDNHYDVISAFIKSMRGSDPDAAVHWLARMIDAGEDPRFIARRMVILAAEDIGLANPQALEVAVNAFQALEFVGMPEARLPLTEAAIYLATSPKSNAVIKAIDRAMDDVKHKKTGEVPLHLRDSNYPQAKELGHGIGYKYPHSYPGNYVEQQYLPTELKGAVYYEPTENGLEKEVKRCLKRKVPKDKTGGV